MADFHPVAIFDLIAFLATLITLVFLWKGWKRVFWREAKVLFIALSLLILSYNLCLFLEWSGLANAHEILENYIGALIPMWWAFVIYAFLQEIAQRELRESEQRYRSVVEDSPGLICSFLPGGKITYANDAYCDYFGKSREELVGQTFLSPIPEHDQATVMANISSLTADAPIQSHEHQVVSGEGEIRWQRWTNRGLFNEQGQAVAFQSFGEDITERKRAEERLRLLSSAVEQSSEGVAVVDLEGNLRFANEAFASMHGYRPEELIGQHLSIFHTSEQMPSVEAANRQIKETGHFSGEIWHARRDGSVFPTWMSNTLLRNAEGNPTAMLGTLRDITEYKRSEEALRELSRRNEALLAAVPDIIAEVDANKKYTWMNPAGYEFFGDDALHHEAADYFEGEQKTYAAIEPLFKGDEDMFYVESWQRRRDGEKRLLAWWCRVLKDDAGNVIGALSTARDITERKRAEQVLQAERDRLESLMNGLAATGIGVDIVSVDYEVLAQNQVLREKFGEPAGKCCYEYYMGLTEPCDFCPMQKAIINNRVESVELKAGDGRNYEFLSAPFANPDGTVDKAIEIVLDITERKRSEAEREKLIQELEAKNAELERFTYTVSHDLKSPLITTKGFVGMLEQDLAQGNQELIAEDMQRISHATDTMERLLEELLELSRIGRIVNPPKEVAFSELVEEALALLSGEPNTQNIQFEVAPDLPVVTGDRIRLRVVLQNLIENSIKFMGNQSEPRIEIGCRQDKGENVFYIRDNGMGIDPRYHEKVFGLFDKLNSEAAGTGIGLAIVKRIAEVHGGRIWVESQGIGHGSTFYFTLATKQERE